MKKTIVFCFVLLQALCSGVTAFAQEMEKDVLKPLEGMDEMAYERETIYLNGNMTRYIKNKTTKKTGLFARFIKHEFDSCSAEAKTEMTSSVKHKKQGALFSLIGGVALVGGLVITGPVGLGLAAAGLVPYTAGLIKSVKGQNKLQKALWLRNRDMLLKQSRQ